MTPTHTITGTHSHTPVILQVIRSENVNVKTSYLTTEHLNTISRTMNTALTEYHFCIIPSFNNYVLKPHW